MDWKQYEELEQSLDPMSEEVQKAYRDCVIEDLTPITESVLIDEWGDAIITCNNRNDITTRELLGWLEYHQTLEGAMFKIRGNKIKLSLI